MFVFFVTDVPNFIFFSSKNVFSKFNQEVSSVTNEERQGYIPLKIGGKSENFILCKEENMQGRLIFYISKGGERQKFRAPGS